MTTFEKRFGARIKAARGAHKPKRMTQQQMATLIGMSHSNYRKTEKGIVRMRVNDMIKMCLVLGITEIKVEG